MGLYILLAKQHYYTNMLHCNKILSFCTMQMLTSTIIYMHLY